MADRLEQILTGRAGFEKEIVDEYTRRLLGLARRRLPERVRQRVDPEDIVQSVYRSFFRRLNEGRFAFDDSHDVWRLLAAMTFHKATKAVQFHQRLKRDVRRERPLQTQDTSFSPEVGNLPEPGENDVATLFGCLEGLLAGLPENHRLIVVRRLEGDTIEQIAERVRRSERTVLRVLARVQEMASHQLESP